MALIRSPRADEIPWRDTLMAGLGAVLIPAVAGGIAFGVTEGLGFGRNAGDGAVAFRAGVLLLAISPLLSSAGMILALPMAGIMLREGWFGWVSAALLGLIVGAAVDAAVHYPVAVPFGAGVMLIMRALLGRLRDME